MGDESPLDGHVIMVINVDVPWCSCCFKLKGPISKHVFPTLIDSDEEAVFPFYFTWFGFCLH